MPWNDIVDEHGATLFRVAFRVLHNAHDAEDITQEVLLEAYQMPQVPNAGLLRRMTTFRAIDRLRRHFKSEQLDEQISDSRFPSPDQISEDRERIHQLQYAISQLPKQQAQCFWLRYVDGLTNQETAAAIGVSASAVSTALNKARTKLRRAIQTETESNNGSK